MDKQNPAIPPPDRPGILKRIIQGIRQFFSRFTKDDQPAAYPPQASVAANALDAPAARHETEAGLPFTEQGALTVIAELKPEKIHGLRKLLDDIIEKDVESNPYIPFKSLRTVHFARFVVIDETRDLKGNILPAKLAFSTNYDAPLDRHLLELCTTAAVFDGMCMVFSACRDFPEKPTNAALLAFLRSHMVECEAFHIGTRGRSMRQIEDEASLRDGVEKMLDSRQTSGTLPEEPEAIRDEILAFARRGGEKWKACPPVKSPLDVQLRQYLVIAALAVACLGIFMPKLLLYGIAALLVTALVWGLLLRLHELRDNSKPVPPPVKYSRDEERELARHEDHVVQNQLTHLVHIKPGMFRLLTLKLVLRSINFLARYYFNKGSLGGIPTIHFARWVIIDEGRRLLFFSNFDGSWENYLGDFIDKASKGLTGVWSNTVGFPKTKWLLWEGATDEQNFKDWTRTHQIATQVWYSAYKTLTVRNINQNSEIRNGLYGTMNREETLAWLRKF